LHRGSTGGTAILPPEQLPLVLTLTFKKEPAQ
jgi:hypothetical protein